MTQGQTGPHPCSHCSLDHKSPDLDLVAYGFAPLSLVEDFSNENFAHKHSIWQS